MSKYFLAYGAERVLHALESKLGPTAGNNEGGPTSLAELCAALKANELEELKLGWKSSDFLTARRSIPLLERALSNNTSVTSVSIGWRKKEKMLLIKALGLIGGHCKELTKLQLVLDDWIPEPLLLNLLAQQTDLVELDIRMTRVMRRDCCREFDRCPVVMQSVCDHSVISRVVVRLNNHAALTTLKLMDCNMNDSAAVQLAAFLQERGGIDTLSLRNNRTLRGRGLAAICQAAVHESLDLSLCDFDGEDAEIIADALAVRETVLGELKLCGNYQIDIDGMLKLTSAACCEKMQALDVSHCGYTDSKAVKTLSALSKLGVSQLRRLTMEGMLLTSNEAVRALCQLLSSASSLRVISIDKSTEHNQNQIGVQQLQSVLEAVQDNYEIEQLDIGRHLTLVWRQIEFYLGLNRAGRRILRAQPAVVGRRGSNAAVDEADWYDVLAGSGGDMSTLYWIVRESAERF